jgi:hypothetical protein
MDPVSTWLVVAWVSKAVLDSRPRYYTQEELDRECGHKKNPLLLAAEAAELSSRHVR